MARIPIPLPSLGNVQGMLSPERAIRWSEVLLVVLLGWALADLTWKVLPAPEESPAPGIGGRAVQGRASAEGADGGAPRSVTLSPALKGLFGQAPETGQGADAPAEPVRETRLDLTLKGVLAKEGSDRKLALIARGGKKEEVYRVGDRVQGAEIVRIETRRVILLRNGVTEALNLEVKQLEGGRSALGGSGGAAGEGIRKTGKHQRTVPRETLDRELGNLPKLLQQAKAVPHSRNGEQVGFRVVNIQSGSVFEELGVKEGDVIRSVNGTPIRTPQEALKTYQKLRTADRFRLDVLRDGQQVTLNYSVQ